MAAQTSKKRKFVADGVFFAELNEVSTRELAEDGYSGVTPLRTEIIIRATRTQNAMELYAEKVNNRDFVLLLRLSLSDTSSSEPSLFGVLCSLLFKPLMLYSCGINAPGLMSLTVLSYLRACYGVLRFIMESGAKGCEVIVSGKLRAQHAKSMKFKDGYMISSGQPVNEYIDSAVRHVLLIQGVLGIKVKIMFDWDPKGKQGLVTPLPDLVTIHTPKEEEEHIRPAIMPSEIKSPMA
ncbi:unnamed protein product [Camellia sinensis]